MFSNDTLFAERLAEMLSEAVAEATQRPIALTINGRELGHVTAKDYQSALTELAEESALRVGVK